MSEEKKSYEKKPPVKVGDTITITPTGYGAKDPFVDYNGYIIFIKKMPSGMMESEVTIRIVSVKQRFGFADYIEDDTHEN